jgi:hypothetical protein
MPFPRRAAHPSIEGPLFVAWYWSGNKKSSWRHVCQKRPFCNIECWCDGRCKLTWCQSVGSHVLSTKDRYLFPNTFCCNKLSRPVYSSYLFDDDDDYDNINILIKFHSAILSYYLRHCWTAYSIRRRQNLCLQHYWTMPCTSTSRPVSLP